MTPHQVLAEDAYEVIQDAIDALEELSDADGEDEEESDDDDDNNSEAEAEGERINKNSENGAAESEVSQSVSKPPVTVPFGGSCFGLLNEPEWGVLWVMGLLACVSLGLMTAMAQVEGCGCGIMACTG